MLTIFCLFFIFLFKHPLLLIFCLVAQRIRVLIFIYTTIWNIWNGFILILIFLGGLLVIFIYLTALTPNELFKEAIRSRKGLYTLLVSLLILHSLPTSPSNFQIKETFFFPNMFNIFLRNFFILLITYLIATLFRTISLCSKNKRPLKVNTYEKTKIITPAKNS